MTSTPAGRRPARTAATPGVAGKPRPAGGSSGDAQPPQSAGERVLCSHCGRTASNGIGCQGICVADSGY